MMRLELYQHNSHRHYSRRNNHQVCRPPTRH